MRFLSSLIIIIALTPILLVFGGWVFPLDEEATKSWQHIRSTVLMDDFKGSVLLIFYVALLAGLIGTFSAWFIARFEFPFRKILSWALILPFALPSFILAMSYGQIFEFAGPVQSFIREAFSLNKGEYPFPEIRSAFGAAFLMSLATYPYVYLSARSAFESQSSDWLRLASVYGHDKYFYVFRVSLAAARPFIVVGILLCVMEAAADIGITELFGVPTLATGLYRLWYYGDEPLVAARMASILVMIAGALLLIERISRKRAQFSSLNQSQPMPRQQIEGMRKWLTSILVALPVLMGFVLPVIWAIRMALFNTRHIRLDKLIDASLDSAILCFIGAMVTITAAFILNYAERRSKGRLKFQWVASLGYAVPGIVIALSLLLVQKILFQSFGWRLIITGSIFGLTIAYLIRFLAPAYQNIHSGFTRIPQEIDQVSESFGKPTRTILREVYLPLLRNPMVYAYLLVTIDILKELPASLILRPFDITTLAITVFEFAGDDRPSEAASYALVLIVFGVIGVYVINRLQKAGHEQG